jgi:hypothetical protein
MRIRFLRRRDRLHTQACGCPLEDKSTARLLGVNGHFLDRGQLARIRRFGASEDRPPPRLKYEPAPRPVNDH